MPHIYDVNRPKGDNRFCGPAVISALTKMTTGEAAAIIRHSFDRRQVTGTSTYQVRSVLDMCGFKLQSWSTLAKKQTLARWLSETIKLRTTGRVFLVVAGNPWQLVEGRRYVCGIVGEVVSVRHEKVKRRARVTEVYEVVGSFKKPTALAEIADKQARRKAELDRDAPHRRTVAQAKREGLVSWDYWDDRTYPPSLLYPGNWWPTAEDGEDEITDPYEGDHDSGDWAQAAEMCDTYRKIKNSLSK